ncbi:MAG: hypothetical protein U0166_27830 [Acidobacteriota bacterium]
MRTITILSLSIVLAASAAPRAQAWGGSPYSLEVLVDGRPLDELPARGTTYVEARRGCEYSIRLHNDTGERVAVALSVDGLNSIDARTTSAQEGRKWILDPWQTVVLDGWQTSDRTARRFVFTTEERSYGRWLGKTENLGIISAAFFRERRPLPPPPYPMPYDEDGFRGGSGREDEKSAPSSHSRKEPESNGLAATGIGREVDHGVVEVAFDAESDPASVVSIRYEYRDALVKLGVLPSHPRYDALDRRERAQGFEGGYAPDPYR